MLLFLFTLISLYAPSKLFRTVFASSERIPSSGMTVYAVNGIKSRFGESLGEWTYEFLFDADK